MLIERFTTWRDAPKTWLLLHSILTMSYTSFLLSCINHVHVAAAWATCILFHFPTDMSLHFRTPHRLAAATVTAISKMITADLGSRKPGPFLVSSHWRET
jgi:hypothetical protein